MHAKGINRQKLDMGLRTAAIDSLWMLMNTSKEDLVGILKKIGLRIEPWIRGTRIFLCLMFGLTLILLHYQCTIEWDYENATEWQLFDICCGRSLHTTVFSHREPWYIPARNKCMWNGVVCDVLSWVMTYKHHIWAHTVFFSPITILRFRETHEKLINAKLFSECVRSDRISSLLHRSFVFWFCSCYDC